MLVETKEHYWKLRNMCESGKHKFRDNNFEFNKGKND